METEMRRYHANFIGGQWRETSGEGVQQVMEAAKATPIAEIRLANLADADAAAEAAAEAFPAWSVTPAAERASFLRRIADELASRSDAIARDIAREVGMPLKLAARIQVAAPIAAWRAFADHAETMEWQDVIGNSVVEKVPAGVVLAITPWNYPLHQITAKVAAALAAGCTVVLKPSELAPLSAYALAEVIVEAGLPAGVFNMVVGRGADIGDALVSHPKVDVVSFTGSTAVGRHVASRAASAIKRISLELGGKSAAIVLDGADVAMATKSTLASCFLNSGQTCSAITRLLVKRENYQQVAAIARDVAEALTIGDPLEPATRMGPLVSANQRDRVANFIRQGLEAGAELVAGGPDPIVELGEGYFVRPTVLGDVAPTSTIAREEVFGPVLCIIPYDTEDEAVAIANGTGYGLAGAVWAGSDETAMRVASRMRAGQVDINGAPFNLQAPFGGFGLSGLGRENGRFGLEEFLEMRAIQRHPEARS
jgi:acyl-CoA reductase-like NAD-dependent aldehyde dehydrogenase